MNIMLCDIENNILQTMINYLQIEKKYQLIFSHGF
jgi:hypothetical protein